MRPIPSPVARVEPRWLSVAVLVAVLALAGCGTPAGDVPAWVKSPANPVLGGDLGVCFDVAIVQGEPSRLWFSWRDRGAIASVTSADGAHWRGALGGDAPVVALGPNHDTGWELVVNRPAVLHMPDGYHLWYTGQNPEHSYIGHAVSADGVTFTRTGDRPVLAPSEPWEKVAVMSPHVLWDEAERTYKMWYSAGDQYEPDVIGYATSRDGIHWMKHVSPVFLPAASPAWDSFKVAGAQVLQQDGWYFMFYIGFEDVNRARTGIARSRDGIGGWERSPANPIIREGGPDAWDSDAVYKPQAIRHGQGWRLYYNGRLGHVEQIGLAEWPRRSLGLLWADASRPRP